MLRKIEWIAALALIVFAICGTRVSGATYFVAKSGNDQNSCQSADEACLTIARASQLAVQPGDVVQVGPGEYQERITIAVGGDESAPKSVVVGRYAPVAAPVKIARRKHPTSRISAHSYFFKRHFGWDAKDTVRPGPSLTIEHDVWIGA